MFFLYADESGDSGLINSPTRYYVLSGIIIHELSWNNWLGVMQNMRQRFKQSYGLKMNEEIHSSPFLTNPGALARIPKHIRLTILREVLDTIASTPGTNVFAVVVDKTKHVNNSTDVFELAWKAFIQRFENTLNCNNFKGPQNSQDFGLVITDNTNDFKLRKILRKMRRFNPIPSMYTNLPTRYLQLISVTEDPVSRDSAHSLFIQAADVVSFSVYQHFAPNSYIKQKGGHYYIHKLDPVLCKAVSRANTGYVLL